MLSVTDPTYSVPVSARLDVAKEALVRLEQPQPDGHIAINPDLDLILKVLIEVAEEVGANTWTRGATR